MCPLAPKAVELETIEVPGADGRMRTLQRPSVVPERCIGCGICEYKCPVEGAAAIRIEGA
jgi:NAD-dependent dihydropyrimidine dehydrogenase PreA subunit